MSIVDNSSTDKKTSPGKQRHGSSSSSSSSSSLESLFSSEDDSSSYPSPPDGDYGWIIVFAAFMINLISDGISFSFGILYTELLNYFEESKSLTSWVGSLFYGSCLMGGPLASALATKYGCRRVMMVGGVVASAGAFVSSFVSSIGLLCVTFGIITGIAMSMGYVSSVVMVAFYFEDRRALATGLSVCGSGIGTFVLAPLTEYLLNVYGWRGTLVIWSGIILNLAVFGALLRPLEFTAQERRNKALQKFERMSRTVSYSGIFIPGRNMSRNTSAAVSEAGSYDNIDEDLLEHCHSQIQIPTYIREKKISIPVDVLKEAQANKAILRDYLENFAKDDINTVEGVDCTEQAVDENEKNLESHGMLFDGHLEDEDVTKSVNTDPVKPAGGCLKKHTHNSTKHHLQGKKQVRLSTYLPLYKRGLFFRGNLARWAGPIGQVKSTSCPELAAVSSESSDEDEWEFLVKYLHINKHMKRVFKALFDPLILKHPLYVLFAISNFLLYFWYDVPYIFMADRAIELGMEESQASFLLSALGIVNTVGQILYGFIGDREVNLSLLYGFSLMCCGVSILLVPLFTDFVPLAVLSGAFGLFISVNYALSTVLLVEFLGLNKLSNAYGLTMLVQGIANLVGPPVAALFYDITLSYDLTFYLGGGFIVFAGGLLLCVPLCRKCRRHLRLEEQTRISTAFNATLTIDKVVDHEKLANGNETGCASLLVDETGAVSGDNETSV